MPVAYTKPEALSAVFACRVDLADTNLNRRCEPAPLSDLTRNADTLEEPASLVKLMTAYMVYQEMKSKGETLDTPFLTLTAQDRAEGGIGERNGVIATGGYSPSELSAGQSLTYREAIWALMGFSANNVAVAAARTISGSQRSFAERMTHEMQQSFGLKRTVFRNATGMPASGQVTTAREMAQLVNALQLRMGADFAPLFGQCEITIGGRYLSKHEKPVGNAIDVLRDNPEISIAKTGTLASTSNLAGMSTDGWIIVVLDETNSSKRNALFTATLRRTFTLSAAAPVIAPMTVATTTLTYEGERATSVPAPESESLNFNLGF